MIPLKKRCSLLVAHMDKLRLELEKQFKTGDEAELEVQIFPERKNLSHGFFSKTRKYATYSK